MSIAVRVWKSKVEKWCCSKGDTLLLKELPGRSCLWDPSEGWWWWTGGPWHIHPGHAWPLSGPTILTPHRTAGKNSPHERTILDWGDGKRHRQLWGFSLRSISPSAWGKGKEIKVRMTQQGFRAKQLLSELLSVRPRNHELRVESRPLPLEWEAQLCPPPQEKMAWRGKLASHWGHVEHLLSCVSHPQVKQEESLKEAFCGWRLRRSAYLGHTTSFKLHTPPHAAHSHVTHAQSPTPPLTDVLLTHPTPSPPSRPKDIVPCKHDGRDVHSSGTAW